jgi:FMN phosphatase YigB (HAD superfamily)
VITTLLLDLDDTLLENKDNIFIPAYFELLSRHLSHLVPKERMLSSLIAGTEAMLENKDPRLYLKEAFDRVFYPGVGYSHDDLLPSTEDFYANGFSELKTLTKTKQGSRDLIEYARRNDLEIVIATNPLYPKTAVDQRLDWAGIPTSQVEYALVTSYENAHFAKPHLEYYAEILAKLGRNPHDAVMIGNDDADDIEPARALGISTFKITENSPEGSQAGELSKALEWLTSSPEMIDPRISATPPSLSARLLGNLTAFGDLPIELGVSAWRKKPDPDNWAAVEVITHLRDVEREINAPRIKSILSKDDPFLSAIESDLWAEERKYIENDPEEVLHSLWEARWETINLLAGESEDVWKRGARHAIFGPTTLRELVLIFIEHDLLHLRQLRSTLKSVA